MVSYALKELIRRYRLYLLTVIMLALVACMVMTLNFLSAAYKDASQLPFKNVDGTIVVQKNGNVPSDISGVLLSCSLAPIGSDVVKSLGGIGGVSSISSALSLWVFDTDHFKRVIGVDWQDRYGTSLAARIIKGAVPADGSQVLVEKTYADKYGLDTGQTLNISGEPFIVSGIIEREGNEIVPSDIYTDLQVAQNMAYQSKNLQAVERVGKTDVNVIIINSGQQDLSSVTASVKQTLGAADVGSGQTPLGQTIGNYNIYTPTTFEDQISTVMRLSDKLIWIISSVLFIGACLIIGRNTLHVIMERRKEFGIFKTVGFRAQDILKLVGLETLFQMLAGFVLGLALTGIAVFILSRTTVSIAIPWELTAYPHFLLANPNDANVVQSYLLPIKIDPFYVMATFLMVMGVGLATALFGAWRISKLRPVEVLKYE